MSCVCEFRGRRCLHGVCELRSHGAAEVRGKFLSTLAGLHEDAVTAAELDRAKNKLMSDAVLNGELPMGRLLVIGTDWITRREYRPVDADIEAVNRVSLDDLHALLRHWPLTNPTIVTLGK